MVARFRLREVNDYVLVCVSLSFSLCRETDRERDREMIAPIFLFMVHSLFPSLFRLFQHRPDSCYFFFLPFSQFRPSLFLRPFARTSIVSVPLSFALTQKTNDRAHKDGSKNHWLPSLKLIYVTIIFNNAKRARTVTLL